LSHTKGELIDKKAHAADTGLLFGGSLKILKLGVWKYRFSYKSSLFKMKELLITPTKSED